MGGQQIDDIEEEIETKMQEFLEVKFDAARYNLHKEHVIEVPSIDPAKLDLKANKEESVI